VNLFKEYEKNKTQENLNAFINSLEKYDNTIGVPNIHIKKNPETIELKFIVLDSVTEVTWYSGEE